jgi:SAM-dependent methyltransferase
VGPLCVEVRVITRKTTEAKTAWYACVLLARAHRDAALAGAAMLYVELALIRYVPGQLRVLGYFTNFVLLAAFLGGGLGMLARRRWARLRLGAWAPVALFAVVGLAELGSALHIVPSPEDFLFLEYRDEGFKVPVYPFLAASFVVLAASFVPLGHAVGETLDGEDPLGRYAANVAGSFAGIALFAVLSGASAPPWVWMAIAAMLTLVGLRRSSLVAGVAAVGCVAATTALVVLATKGSVWSPYQKVTVGPINVLPDRIVQEWELPRLAASEHAHVKQLTPAQGFTVRVNDDSYQLPMDLRPEAVLATPALGKFQAQYDLPFKLRPHADDVLVLGAGTGNDVAGALRAGALHVDAVEIDPEIVTLGARHPERPYADPRVTVHVTDARSFLARTDRTYDAIVFALVDSHVLLNATSPVRLDSFVFTRESFVLARKHLKPDGLLFVSHAVGTLWFFDRMRKTLTEAFDFKPPLTIRAPHAVGILYAAGPSLPPGPPMTAGVTVLEDDWPFLYLRSPMIPHEYLYAMLIIAVLSALGVRVVSRKRFSELDPHFFFLGAAFFLLETRGVTTVAVNLGSTWIVNAAVFAAVLVMAFVATLIARSRATRESALPWRAYGLLLLLFVVSFAVPVGALASLPFALRAATSALVVVLPLLASGIVFAVSLARTAKADSALAANLFGAMTGGLVEYVSMLMGFRMMLLVAAMFYLVALLFDVRGRQGSVVTAA